MTEQLTGRDLDRAVAEKVFGIESPAARAILTIQETYLRAFSGSIFEAWLVMEKMRERGWDSRIEQARVGWGVRFFRSVPFEERLTVGQAVELSAPEAICRAALRAIEEWEA